MRRLRRRQAREAIPGEASEPSVDRVAGIVAGSLAGAATFALAVWASGTLAHRAPEVCGVAVPLCVSAFTLALIACPPGRWRSPWPVVGVAVLLSVGPVAWRWHIGDRAESVADAALGVPSAGLGALAGWVIVRRWRGLDCPNPGRLVATAIATPAAVVLASAFVSAAPDPPPGPPAALEWLLCAVAVGGASRLPHSVLTATGVAAAAGLGAGLIADARWPILLAVGHALLALLPGLILQAVLELREEPRRRLKRRAQG